MWIAGPFSSIARSSDATFVGTRKICLPIILIPNCRMAPIGKFTPKSQLSIVVPRLLPNPLLLLFPNFVGYILEKSETLSIRQAAALVLGTVHWHSHDTFASSCSSRISVHNGGGGAEDVEEYEGCDDGGS